MLALDARFALLVLFCTLSTQWMAPISGVDAAAIARQPASRRSSGNVARYYRSPEHHMQRVLPWTRHHGRGRGAHHKRMESNPFSEFAQAVFSGFKNKFHHKRSHMAIVIPNNHGGSYLVPHARRAGATTPLWLSNQTSTTNQTADSAQSQDLSAEGVPGIVVIASHVYSATSDDEYKPIAYLFKTEQNGEYEFNASDTNQTQLYLVDVPTNATTRELTVNSAPEDSPVNLVFPTDSDSYCLTFDPNPGNTAQVMTGQKCIRSGASADAVDTTHMSQTFAYNRTSGVLRPMWYAGEDDGTMDTTTAQDVAAAASAAASASASGNSTSAAATDSAPGAQATSTALGTRDDAAPRAPQNVTLIFVPMTPKAKTADVDGNNAAPAQAQSSASPSASPSGVASAAAVAPPSASASGAMSAEAIAPTSASASGAGAPSSASAAPAAGQSAAGLSVELVDGANVPPPAASASSASAPSAASSSSAPTPSVNAAAVPAALSSSSSAPAQSANAAEVAVGQSSSSAAAPAPSVNAAAVPDTQSSSAAAAPAPSVNAAAVAASIASSASASSASASASASAAVAAASVDPSAPSASASATPSGASSPSFVAAVVQREAAPAKTPVSTAPYIWKFQADSR